jgi:nucleoside permease NupC
MGDQINIFLDYSDAGSMFVFGDSFKAHFFAFKVS